MVYKFTRNYESPGGNVSNRDHYHLSEENDNSYLIKNK